MTHDELEDMVLSHEKALLVVAETENMGNEAIEMIAKLALAALVMAFTALVLVVFK